MAEFAVFRGVGGGLHRFRLPLAPPFAAQEAKGLLVRVDEETPAPLVEPDPDWFDEDNGPSDVDDMDDVAPNVDKPNQGAPKSVWVGWAVLVSELTREQANALTKAELIKQYG